MKNTVLVFLMLLLGTSAFAQSAKKNPPPANRTFTPAELAARKPSTSVPPAEQVFGIPTPSLKPMPAFIPGTPAPSTLKITRDENGMPIFFESKPEIRVDADRKTPAENALAFLVQLQPAGILDPANEFVVSSVQTDEQGNYHVRLQQVLHTIPVYGAELIAHSKNGYFISLGGRYYPSEFKLTTNPAIAATTAYEQAMADFGPAYTKTRWTAEELKFIGGATHQTQLVVYHPKTSPQTARLAWYVEAHPNLLKRVVYFVDAQTGAVIHHFDHTCKIDGGRHVSHKTAEVTETAHNTQTTEEVVVGPVTANGLDLLDNNRSFGAWQVSGSQIVLEDASKSMFNSGQSNMPNDPVGAIITLSALGTSPEVQSTFNYDFVSATGLNFNNKTAVSGHWNSSKSYDYFKNTFNRNSIDGVGGNIIAFVEVADNDGSSMENAFWNGAAMWYGNGGSTFKRLARGLDVGGHEMTHGVVEKTANLEYQDESGAMNESFADIFGAMIDRDDWKIGEDVMQTGVNPTNCLRDLSNPNNGVSSNSPWWQPKQMSEKYNGSDDNGGVHINSGITNRAFFLFASNASVGKDKAEQVYYKALRDYLVKSSKFTDLRIAVLQASNDLYGATVAQAAASAFDVVGIVGNQPSGNYQGQLNPNPGDEYVLCVSDNGLSLDLALGTGQLLGSIYNEGVQSRPSISDNGQQIVFVNSEGHIITVDMQYTQTNIIPVVNPPFSASPIWRNAVISKDGRFIAGITQSQDNRVYIFDLADPNLFLPETFFLYNPTYSQTPTITGEVRYADVLEFDYSGSYLMYDAFNELTSANGQDLSYWDIGFLQFWENGAFVNTQTPFISKLFSGLPENTSVGDPSFAKNSPFVIAFDFFDSANDVYEIYGANTETGDYARLVADNGALGWPSYNRLDNKILFESPTATNVNLYTQGLKANKIEPQGGIGALLNAHQWGVWYAEGDRSLQVATQAPISGLHGVQANPNPTSGITQLNVQSDVSVDAQIVVNNILGATVYQQTTQLVSGSNQLNIDLSALPTGAYVVRILAGKSAAALKIIRE